MPDKKGESKKDAMPIKQLWAPWRMDFIKDSKKTDGCVFCALIKEKEDRKNLILHRAENIFVILNKYPYNNGHLMIVPHKHTASLSDLSKDEASDLMDYGRLSVEILTKSYKPEGFNLGMNLGASAGAGIRDHLHLHVVPRWNGDTNFMPVTADTKSMPQHLETSFDQLAPFFKNIHT